MVEIPLADARPVEVVSFIPVLSLKRDRDDRAVAPGPSSSVSVDITRSDGKRDVRQVRLQDGVRLVGEPPWYSGPAPFAITRTVIEDSSFKTFKDDATRDERLGFVSDVVAARLYADGVREHRAAVAEDQHAAWVAAGSSRGAPMPNVIVLCLELIRFPSTEGLPDAVLMVHATVRGQNLEELVAGLRLVAMKNEPRRAAGERGREWLAHLARGVGEPACDLIAGYHLAYESPEGPLPIVDVAQQREGWAVDEQWRWMLATLHTGERYTTSEENRKQLENATITLSGDWRATVFRRGATILTRELSEEWVSKEDGRYELDFLAEVAPLLARSLLADALALGVIKRLMLDGFVTRLAALGDPVAEPKKLGTLDSDVTRFRNTMWWDDMGRFGQGSFLLRNYDAALGLGARFERLIADLSDYAQKVERDALAHSNTISQGTNALIGLVTCFGVPLGALQVFTTDRTWVWIAIMIYMVLLGLVPAGDQVIRGLMPVRAQERVGLTARVIWCAFWTVLIGSLLAFGVIPAAIKT